MKTENFAFIDKKGELKQGSSLLKLAQEGAQEEKGKKSKKQLELNEMQVMGIEDVEMKQTKQGSLFKEDEMTSLEEKLTASSNLSHKGLKTSGSIATVLS